MLPRRITRIAIAWSGILVLVASWSLLAGLSSIGLIPGPLKVIHGLWELTRRGLLAKHVIASLFRVTWGYLLAVALGIPLGLALGWFRRGERALNPLLQLLRPISPLAWIPIAILWFGVGDAAAIFIIFTASLLPITTAAASAVAQVPTVHLRAGRNFGLSSTDLLRRIVYPSAAPQLLSALRLTLGIAWLVVVAAEMIAVSSGLGFLIIDSRNAGNRYDLVIAGMVIIGLIGLALDGGMRRFEKLAARKAA